VIFSWDDLNRDHIARHGVSPDEAENVVHGAENPFPQAIADDKWLVWGATESGRHLQVIYVVKMPSDVSYESLAVEDWISLESGKVTLVIRVIHAMDLTARMKPASPASEVVMTLKKQTIDENDFDALDRLAHSITLDQLRPLKPQQRSQWETIKRGRPKKPPGTKAVPTLITVEPQLLRRADAYAKKTGVSRSQLFSDAIRRKIELAR
jgi:uncharacterized DUF497 family protein